MSQYQEQRIQFDKLKYENIDLKLKIEESKDLSSRNVLLYFIILILSL